jgi:Phytanoyl-CoA dioxygenase (PhyH)
MIASIWARLKTLHMRTHKNRHALTARNLNYLLWRYVANLGRTTRVLFNTPESAVANILSDMNRDGIIVSDSNRFLSVDGRRVLASVAATVLESAKADCVRKAKQERIGKIKDYLVDLVPLDYAHSPDSDLLKLALDPKLLDIVSSYLGMWPRLHAIYVWLNFPTPDEARESQLWHRDSEDIRMVKAFIYLVDVDETTGPFSYIPRTQAFGELSSRVPVAADMARITDVEMESVLPRRHWLACTGPAGTMILADPIGYHRGGKPTKGDRILVSFSYTSGTPMSRRKLQVQIPPWASDMQRAALI